MRGYSWRGRYWVYVIQWSVLGKWIRVGCVKWKKMRDSVWEVNESWKVSVNEREVKRLRVMKKEKLEEDMKEISKKLKKKGL